MKILITGAAGFIGSHLAEKLVDLGHSVTGLDSFTDYYSPQLKRLNAADLVSKGVSIIEKDLTAPDLNNEISGFDVIYHLAAQPGISATTPFESYLRNNIIATQNLISSVPNDLKLFVNIATSSVYGAHATDNEDAAPKPTSHYGVTKLAAEQLVMALNRDKGFPAVSMRLFSVYGERERPEKLYPKLINSILNDKEFPLYEGSEHHLRSYSYVGDIVDGLSAVLEDSAQFTGQIFNIGTDKAITTGEGIKIVEDILGKKAKIVVKPKRPGDQKETHANIDKARRMFSYDPVTLPEEGLRREVEWFKDKIWKKINLYQ
ncbi:NAD-dependent epimerase/dehydratase family protein [candidate division WWE3 bacterium]|jgi:nucleoside-diphosphate-sugar epimerase|uniref:NAD-dependent epimerase/dehydratase family protein n=1 Tax=candidate division WWE3 bacterium TaxID=2053526 RepID=A0A3A4ZK88_UNCKA|nr:MAG: NAD-dependent epimerase/dehydratase family protein [candidate division WWE3 bacterium]